MKTPTKFREYIWLVNTIRKAGRITFAQIQEKWLETDMSEGIELAHSTFYRHKDAIEDIFGIFIECDRKDGYKFYIGNEEVLSEDSVQNWMLSTLSVNHVISESLSLQDRILLDRVPSGQKYLQQVINAMKQKVRIIIKYKRYGTEVPKEFTLEPYCIKLFKQRWYLLGHFHREATPEKKELDYMATFAFDRIINLEPTNIKFKMRKDFDARSYFKDSFGVLVLDDVNVERVVVRAFANERFYLRDLPIHASQREIAQGENYSDFELLMRPTVDFSSYVLGRSNQLKVLEPQWLVDEVYQMLLDALNMYKQP